MAKILAISSSVMGSKSRALIDTLVPMFDETHELDIFDLKDHEMMFADGRDYRDYTGSTQDLIKKIIESDAIVISTPIFQASIPGSLKNIFDLLPIDSLKDKMIAVVVSAGSDKHFLVAEYQLKPILKYMKAEMMDPYIFVKTEDFLDNKIINDDIMMRLEMLVVQFQESIEEQRLKQERINSQFDF